MTRRGRAGGRALLLACCLSAAVAIATLEPAAASPEFAATFEMHYGSSVPGTSTSLSTHMTWTDPGETAAKPKEIKTIVFRFHRGTRFDTSALPACRASDKAVSDKGAAVCPRGSRVGSGSTKVNTGTSPIFGTQVTFFNARHQLIVLVKAAALTITVFRDEVVGDTITVNTKIPPGFALTDLQVVFRTHNRRAAGRRRSYFRTPPTCPASGVWTTTATFTYTDGSSQTLTSTTPCRAASY
jgi:hypothetical protein